MSLSRKFSHKTFWPEVYESGANRLQYVGELCRYLVNAPVHPLDRKHRLQEAWGNGKHLTSRPLRILPLCLVARMQCSALDSILGDTCLLLYFSLPGMRPDVWEAFRQRFNIPIIHELYAATDGMGATFNANRGEFSRNAIGVRGLLWHFYNGGREVRAKIDPDTENIIRGHDGFVIKAGIDEPGEVLHNIDPSLKSAAFRGYFKNEQASEKRWLTNVFKPNDLWFRSGDVMREDADGRVFFVDRLGDTFRWKSENVSTNEVSDVMGTFEQIAECNVYGVGVPHADGRCGAAVIVTQPPTIPETLDMTALARHVTSRLPKYAVPLFLRVATQLSYTGTFKIQKGPAKREGVDIDLIEQSGSKDKLFWLPAGSTSYVPYRREDWEALKDGRVRL